MDSFTRADLFFAVTTGAVVLITVCVVIALGYVIRILHETRSLIELVRKEGELLSADLSHLRMNVTTQGFKWAFVLGFLRKIWSRRTARKKNKQQVD
ncbi:MAG: hypothetical protein A2542_01645 [Parcubacteria group bacterium RIFOXYD2_FULL_52_8]|nr:MAG: hypothetical protein A2542_01645 [Parcubacteria group bacterium RIFOXYD2_FULL_52_8]